jgi:beta-glucosidase-like glycosyl hydrolase
MMMEPNAYQSFQTTLIDEVHAGRISMSRIDDAVSRILIKKFQLGLFEHPFTDRSALGAIGAAAHRAVAGRAVAESQVLLKNDRQVLPLRRDGDVYVAGSNADKAAVDKVCAAAKKCVMVIVSGRPLILDPAQLAKIDGLVAAWLPGSEGAGVADTRFGTRPYMGKLPVTWPRARAGADQRRRRELRPAVSVRVRAQDAIAEENTMLSRGMSCTP